MDERPAYPEHWEADVVLRDGGTAHLRPIRTDDADALQTFHVNQSERSTYLRFFTALERLPERDLARFTQVDHRDRVALVVLAGQGEAERIIAVARYDRTEEDTAEVAFNVADDHHGRGLGSVLLEHLAAAARERGIRRFTADVLPQNARMIGVFREAGYAVRQSLDDGVLAVSIDIDPTERSLAVMADREHRGEARSVRGLLTPASVLVVVEPDPDGEPAGEPVEVQLARAAVLHLLGSGEPGAVKPAPEVVLRPVVHVVGDAPVPGEAHRWASVGEVPGPIDLLVLAVPADRAADVVRDCVPLTPRAVLVLSGGYAETGPMGLALQRAMVRTARSYGMRVLGPASYGFFRHGTAGAPTVNASLTAVVPQPGRVALFCQSAPLAVGLLTSVRRRRVGLSTFVSSGHRADVSGNDVMQFWSADDETDVVGLYLESIGNPRKFARVARRLAAAKPVVVLTAGRSGHVIPAGHAVRLTHVPRRALDEILRQAGVIRVDSQHQLLDVVQLLGHQPLPTGRRVSVLADSEPMAGLVAEAAVSAGLTVSDRRVVLAPGERTEAEMERLEAVLADVYGDPAADAVVVVHVPTIGAADTRVARAVARAAATSGRTTVACMLDLSGLTPELTAVDGEGRAWTVPAYAAPEDGVAALAAAARYGAWRSADHGHRLAPAGLDRPRARALVEGLLAGHADDATVALDGDDVVALLGCYGISVVPSREVRDGLEAVTAAAELGWPVALKCTSPILRHRLDLGGVRLDLAGPAALFDAVRQMQEGAAGADGAPVPLQVQTMVPGGAACVIRSSEDPRFGPVLSFGLAGDATDLLGDVSYGVAPLTDVDVAEMVRAVRAGPRLFGYRGQPALDVAALEDVLGRVSVMADDLPELRSLELHPVLVAEHGARVLSATAELAHAGRVDNLRRALP